MEKWLQMSMIAVVDNRERAILLLGVSLSEKQSLAIRISLLLNVIK
jgi:hypothetical protein